MMITADGKVGIGVSSNIDSLLHVAGADAQINIEGTSGDATLKLESTGNSYWNIFNDDSDARKLKFEDNGNGVALTLERDGDVGIGTTSPDTRLDITAAGVQGILMNQYTGNAAASARLLFKDSTRTNAIVNVNGQLQFRTGSTVGSSSGTQRMVIEGSNGRVGIGTTSPSQVLDVAGIIQSTSSNPQVRINTSSGTGAGYLVFGDSADDDRGWISYQHASDAMEFRVNASVAMTINSNGYLVFPDGQITSDGTNFIIDGASGKEVIVSSARDVRLIIDDNNDDTNNEFQIFKHNDDSASNKILSLTQAGALTINGEYTFPTSDGSANQVLQTDGSGNLSFATVSGGGGVSISNNVDNRVLTGDGSNANAEANLTFDGSTLTVTGDMTMAGSSPTLSIPAHSGIEIDITGSASSGNIRANTDLYLLSQTAGLHLGAGEQIVY